MNTINKWVTKVVCSVSLALIQSILAEPRILHFHQKFPSLTSNNEVHYEYSYAIDDKVSGVVTDRWEERRGEYVKGAYSLLEPGGKVRTVDYQVDGNGGFQAIVKTMLPGQYLLSTQQFLKSKEIHPQTSPENYLGPVYPNLPRNDETVPVNYHALNAQKIGYRKIHPQSPTEESSGLIFPNLPRNDERVPVNYHALNAQQNGYKRLFGTSLNRLRGQSRDDIYRKRIALQGF